MGRVQSPDAELFYYISTIITAIIILYCSPHGRRGNHVHRPTEGQVPEHSQPDRPEGPVFSLQPLLQKFV
jgi:hypothetical protein